MTIQLSILSWDNNSTMPDQVEKKPTENKPVKQKPELQLVVVTLLTAILIFNAIATFILWRGRPINQGNTITDISNIGGLLVLACVPMTILVMGLLVKGRGAASEDHKYEEEIRMLLGFVVRLSAMQEVATGHQQTFLRELHDIQKENISTVAEQQDRFSANIAAGQQNQGRLLEDLMSFHKESTYIAAEQQERFIAKLSDVIKSIPTAERAYKQEVFNRLAETWQSETELISSIEKKSIHTAYQRIIGMGEAAIPLILRELKDSPNHWFWALSSITGENPIKPENAGKMRLMADDWLAWGEREGYITK